MMTAKVGGAAIAYGTPRRTEVDHGGGSAAGVSDTRPTPGPGASRLDFTVGLAPRAPTSSARCSALSPADRPWSVARAHGFHRSRSIVHPSLYAALRRHRGGHGAGGDRIVLRPGHPRRRGTLDRREDRERQGVHVDVFDQLVGCLGLEEPVRVQCAGVSRSGWPESAACTAMCWLRRPGVPAASTRRTRSMLSATLSPCPKTATKHRRSGSPRRRESRRSFFNDRGMRRSEVCAPEADVAYAVDLRRALPTVRCGIVDSVPVDRCPSRQSRRGMCPRTAESVRYSRVGELCTEPYTAAEEAL